MLKLELTVEPDKRVGQKTALASEFTRVKPTLPGKPGLTRIFAHSIIKPGYYLVKDWF